jgi:outer membrane autotransporter protein
MKTTKDGFPRWPRKNRPKAKVVAALLAGLLLGANAAHSLDAIWSLNPIAGDNFNNPGNWLPPVVPTDTAFFGFTNGRSPLIMANTTLSQILFTGLAPSYSIGVFGPNTLELNGGGIANSSSNNQVIVVLAGGTLTFANDSTAGNNTIGYSNRGGTINFNNSSAGSANFENESNGTITFLNGHAGNAIISNNFGAATITFEGASSADSATINNFTTAGGGSIIFTGTSTAGNAAITNFTANDFITFEGTSSAGSATITTDSGSTINFTGASTGSQARFIVNSGGVFDMSALTTAGMTAGSIEGAGTYNLGSKELIVGLNDLSTQVSGVIADGGASGGTGGSIVKVGTGTLTLLGTNTYSGGTSFIGGVLAIERDANLGTGPLSFDGGTLEALAAGGGITSAKAVTLNALGGTFLADAGTASVLSGLIAGTGSFTKAGLGELTLTANNSYTGGTTISGGMLQLGNGGTTGSIVGNVTDNGTLVFNHGGPKNSFNGVISGTGAVTKLGTDILQLTANNTYSGGTTIQSGVLVAGIPAGSSQIASNALGTGNVSLMGGTLRTPSLDPLQINVGGNYTQGPNGTLALGIGGLNGQDYDHVQVGGNASLSGNLVVSSLNGFHPVAGNAFEVLHANGTRNGNFTHLDDSAFNDNPNISPLLRPITVEVVAPNGILLVYLGHTQPLPPEPPVIDNEPNPVPPVNPEEPIPDPILVAVLDPTAEQLTSLFEIGFSAANTQRFKLDERFDQIQRDAAGYLSNTPPAPPPIPATGKEIASKQPAPPPPPPEKRWGVWANGWGDWVTVDNSGVARGYNFTTGGFIAGVDYRITDNFAVGILGGYSHTWTNLQPSGNIDVNSGRGGLYLTYFNKCFYLNAATYGGYNSYSSSRQGLLGSANGSTSGGEFSTWTESGYQFHLGNFTVGPMAALQYTLVDVNGFNESGSLLPLRVHSDQEASLRTDVGLKASYTWQIGNISVIPTLLAAWEHEYFYSALPITVSTPEFPGNVKLFGPDEGRNSAIVNAGAAIQWTPQISTYIGYQGQLGRDNYSSNTVTGGISFSF